MIATDGKPTIANRIPLDPPEGQPPQRVELVDAHDPECGVVAFLKNVSRESLERVS